MFIFVADLCFSDHLCFDDR